MRYKIELAYNGSNYAGWQIQPNALTVQALIDRALSTIANTLIETVGCGRTDAGVHAKYFVAHFDGPENLPNDLDHRLNRMLPNDIQIFAIHGVHDDFHARFDAIKRTYEYHVAPNKDPFSPRTFWWNALTYDIQKMNDCAELLVGVHNFSCFCKGEAPNNNPQCQVQQAYWTKTDQGYKFTISSNRFLRNMVRAIVGTLLDVGSNKLSKNEFIEIFTHGNRSDAGSSVPAEGLFLTEVHYPNKNP